MELVEKLPRVRRKGFDVFALAFGVDRIESERRLAGTTDAGNHDQLVARNLQREIFEIVLTRAADLDEFFRHALRVLRLSGHERKCASLPDSRSAAKRMGKSGDGTVYTRRREHSGELARQ